MSGASELEGEFEQVFSADDLRLKIRLQTEGMRQTVSYRGNPGDGYILIHCRAIIG
jgi:hypothetical protein